MKKKMFTLLVMPFAFLSSSQAQITQYASDSIVLERMSLEIRPHTVYAKTDTTAITTKASELLELDYPCRVYYIRYDDQADVVPASRSYFAVTENGGNVLDVNTKNDVSPNDLEAWRIVYLCRFDNPLTDLLWLKEIIDEFETEAETLGYNPHAKIYQCSYKNGTGFLLKMCEECPFVFRDCQGNILCDSSDIRGINTCSELDIDFENKSLIWAKEETLCHCIMDTLKGEWKVFKFYSNWFWYVDVSASALVLKILSQNEDASISYEVFVEDTLFYKGSFQYDYEQYYHDWHYLTIIKSDIKVPYVRNISEYPYSEEHDTGIFAGELLFLDMGIKTTKGVLTFFMSGVVDGHVNYYEKIK